MSHHISHIDLYLDIIESLKKASFHVLEKYLKHTNIQILRI